MSLYDIAKNLNVAALLDASLLCMDANNNYINLYVATGKDK